MYKIITNKKNKLALMGRYGEECIHVVHCSNDINDLKEDCENLYIVAEECTNFAMTHLVTAFSEDEALQQIDEYLRENEEAEDTHLIGVFKAEL